MPSTSAGRRQPLPDTIQVGRVGRPHGLRGEVRVDVESDVADRFARGQQLLLTWRGQPSATMKVASFRAVKAGALVRFATVEDRDQAAALRGARIEVARQDVPPAPDGVYYTFELVGCQCTDRQTGPLGVVDEVIEDGGGMLLAVTDDQTTLLVPFVRALITEIDVERGTIVFDLPAGLIETCTSKL